MLHVQGSSCALQQITLKLCDSQRRESLGISLINVNQVCAAQASNGDGLLMNINYVASISSNGKDLRHEY